MFRPFALLTSLLLAGGMSTAAVAADPESAEINDNSHSAEWTGGPFVFTNLTPLILGLAGEQALCIEGEACDIFRFSVNVSEINEDEDTVVITVEWPDVDGGAAQEVPDFDVYLYDDETGDYITNAASSDNPEIIILAAQNRKYRLEIIPFTPMAQSYTGRVTYVPIEDDKSGLLGFAGAFAPAALLALALGGLLAAGRRRGSRGC